MGDPIFCSNCSASFNCHSKCETVNKTQKLWTCEFCKHPNTLNIEEEEIPKKDDVLYVLQSAVQV